MLRITRMYWEHDLKTDDATGGQLLDQPVGE